MGPRADKGMGHPPGGIENVEWRIESCPFSAFFLNSTFSILNSLSPCYNPSWAPLAISSAGHEE